MQYRSFEHDSLDLDPTSPFFADHVTRYWWAHQFAKDQDVLDCACGKGYGTFILSLTAKLTLGIDLNRDSIETAKRNFQAKRNNLNFRLADCLKIDQLGRQFDCIIAFEVIEHLPADKTHRFLNALHSACKPGGVVLISTPNHEVVLRSGVEVPEFHINNFTSRQLNKVLRQHFAEVQMLGQFRKRQGVSSVIFDYDFFNLRHVVANTLRRKSGSPVANLNPPLADRANFDYQSRPTFLDRYVFSPAHWRQAGLTLAVCRPRPPSRGSNTIKK